MKKNEDLLHFFIASDFKCHRLYCNFAADLGNASENKVKKTTKNKEHYGKGNFEFGDGYDRHFVHVFYRWSAIMRVMSDKMKILFAYIKKKK